MYSSTRRFESHTVFEDLCNEGENVAFLICFDECEFQRILHLPRFIRNRFVSSCSIRTALPFQSRRERLGSFFRLWIKTRSASGELLSSGDLCRPASRTIRSSSDSTFSFENIERFFAKFSGEFHGGRFSSETRILQFSKFA